MIAPPPPPVVKAAPPPPPPPPPPPAAEEIFQVVEDMPRFPGCENEPKDQTRRLLKKEITSIYL